MRVVAFTGSRGWLDTESIARALGELDPTSTVIVVGDARGVDYAVFTEAERLGFFVARMRAAPHWKRLGRSAGIRRNAAMLELGVGRVIAFWDGESPGTANMVTQARARGLPVAVHYPDGSVATEG